MKKFILLSGLIPFLVFSAFVRNKKQTDVYKIDTKLSSLEWYAEKLTGKHNGTILFSNGMVNSDHGSITGTFDIDMKSIENKDMEPGEWRSKLENHLKSPDFFDTEKYPKSTFVITSAIPIKVTQKDGFTHKVKGMLTIKDKTNEITFDAKIIIDEKKATCIGSAVVDRSKFDVRYGSKTFFADIGDKMIYDEFTLKFNAVAFK